MKSRNLIVILFAMGLIFAAGVVSRPFVPGFAGNNGTKMQTLTFDSTVTSYQYSEQDIVRIEKIDDRNYAITAANPGMCVLTFSTSDDSNVPDHARRGRFVVSVSPNKSLTIQETKFVAGGML